MVCYRVQSIAEREMLDETFYCRKTEYGPGNWPSAAAASSAGKRLYPYRRRYRHLAYGHVLQQAEPQDYDPKYKRWNAEDLPIIPTEWKLLISPASKEQFHIIEGLIQVPTSTPSSTPVTPTGKAAAHRRDPRLRRKRKSPSSASCSTPSMKKASMNP